MTKQDSLQRFMFENAPVRGEFVRLHESVQTILTQHPYPLPVKKLLSQALCVAALLSAVIKFEGRLTVQFRGSGGLKLLMAQCDNQFHLRGLAKYDADLTYDDLINAFHDGVLAITLDNGSKHHQYQGVVPWQGHSLAESIEGYFRDSEQLPTKIWLSSDDYAAAGFLLQAMPGEDLSGNHAERMMSVLKLNDQELMGMDVELILKTYYPDQDIRVFDPVDVSFRCTCSRESGENAIAIIGRAEAEAELKNKQSILVTCDFCNQEYLFDRIDVANIFESRDKLPPNTHLH